MVSAAFKDAPRRPHQVRIRVDSYRGTTLLKADLPVTDGEVTLDARQAHYRSARLTLVAPKVTLSTTDPLSPTGQYLRISRGFYLPGIGEEYSLLGEFPIMTAVSRRPEGLVDVECGDWSTKVGEYAFLSDGKPAKTATPLGEIERLCEMALPDKEVVISHDGTLTGKTISTDLTYPLGGDRWAAVREMATDDGADIWWDDSGVLKIARALDSIGLGTVVGRLDGGEGGVLVSAEFTVSRADAHNGVRVVIEPRKATRRVKQSDGTYDDVPIPSASYTATTTTGPTAWGDTFGRIPLIERRKATTPTKARAEEIAKALLKKRHGVSRAVAVDIVPMPYLRPRDTVEVVVDGVTEKHRVEAVTVPLTPSGVMRVRTRQLLEDG